MAGPPIMPPGGMPIMPPLPPIMPGGPPIPPIPSGPIMPGPPIIPPGGIPPYIGCCMGGPAFCWLAAFRFLLLVGGGALPPGPGNRNSSIPPVDTMI